LKFLLDEDLPPRAAQIARGLELDAVSVHELGRVGLTDAAQLRFAAREGRVFVTRNRDDFRALTLEFHRAGEAHAGVLIVGRRIPNNRPERIAHALKRWTGSGTEHAGSFGAYEIDFL
jgi:predicted nuclease of predicted toxin-antitoxin system